jgi:flavodoxin
MKTAIVYYSAHHSNTKKLLDAITAASDVTLIEAVSNQHTDLSAYELIGFASGIYNSKFHGSVLRFAEENLPHGKKVFFIYTCGMKRKNYTDVIRRVTDSKGAQLLGVYGCLGFDTFGPLKLIGGVAKGRPNDEDISGAMKFFDEVREKGEISI